MPARQVTVPTCSDPCIRGLTGPPPWQSHLVGQMTDVLNSIWQICTAAVKQRVCVCFIIHDYRKEIARKQAKIHKVKNCYRCYRKPVEFLVKFNSHNYFSAFSPTIGRRTHTYPCFRCVYLCSSESLSLFASCQFFFLLVSCLDFFEPLLTADCWEPVPEIKLYWSGSCTLLHRFSSCSGWL